ncbi:hypothetical protein [Halobellus ruber]|uniref:Uncharacterized protein n=1 Tax=Halobellus ruber TaxID=2761102 RepID=A0A7J9SNJ3_9EURY|nr:hypothetical protein [Halobellus ruber]MBB6646751.1 hypothetical protein [Halobellus ruber]
MTGTRAATRRSRLLFVAVTEQPLDRRPLELVDADVGEKQQRPEQHPEAADGRRPPPAGEDAEEVMGDPGCDAERHEQRTGRNARFRVG